MLCFVRALQFLFSGFGMLLWFGVLLFRGFDCRPRHLRSRLCDCGTCLSRGQGRSAVHARVLWVCIVHMWKAECSLFTFPRAFGNRQCRESLVQLKKETTPPSFCCLWSCMHSWSGALLEETQELVSMLRGSLGYQQIASAFFHSRGSLSHHQIFVVRRCMQSKGVQWLHERLPFLFLLCKQVFVTYQVNWLIVVVEALNWMFGYYFREILNTRNSHSRSQCRSFSSSW